MTWLDRRAALVGAGVTLVVLVPPIAALRLALGDFSDDSNLWLVALAIFFVGTLAGGNVAARLAGQRQLAHGAVAAGGAFVVALVLGIARRALSGGSIVSTALFLTAVFFTLLAASLGILGGLAARRRSLRREATA